MRCAICGQAVNPSIERVVPTMTGGLVHIACADQEARRAYRNRTYRAASSTVVAIVLIGFVRHANIGEVMFLILLTLLVVGHICLNLRWWRVTVLMCRRRWR